MEEGKTRGEARGVMKEFGKLGGKSERALSASFVFVRGGWSRVFLFAHPKRAQFFVGARCSHPPGASLGGEEAALCAGETCLNMSRPKPKKRQERAIFLKGRKGGDRGCI